MPALFSYLQHPMMLCLKLIPKVFKDINKVLVFYYNPETNDIDGRYVTKDDDYSLYHEMDFTDIKDKIQRHRQQKNFANWYAKEELEFELESAKENKTRQLKLNDEDQKKILRLSFENKNDQKSDIVFIYFDSLLHIFPVSGNKELTTRDKSIIQNVTISAFAVFLENEIENKGHFENVAVSARNILTENDKLKKKNEALIEKQGQMVLNQCQLYLRKFEKENPDMPYFEFSEECENKLRTYSGKADDLEKIVAQAAWAAANFFYDNTENKVTIHEGMINFGKVAEKRAAELQETGFDEDDSKKYFKAIALLNKYEDATVFALNNNEKITINSIGIHCKPIKVTGAAVSDSIKKYKDDFNYLYAKYPDKWLHVKKNLRPLSSKIINKDLYKVKQA